MKLYIFLAKAFTIAMLIGTGLNVSANNIYDKTNINIAESNLTPGWLCWPVQITLEDADNNSTTYELEYCAIGGFFFGAASEESVSAMLESRDIEGSQNTLVLDLSHILEMNPSVLNQGKITITKTTRLNNGKYLQVGSYAIKKGVVAVHLR